MKSMQWSRIQRSATFLWDMQPFYNNLWLLCSIKLVSWIKLAPPKGSPILKIQDFYILHGWKHLYSCTPVGLYKITIVEMFTSCLELHYYTGNAICMFIYFCFFTTRWKIYTAKIMFNVYLLEVSEQNVSEEYGTRWR